MQAKEPKESKFKYRPMILRKLEAPKECGKYKYMCQDYGHLLAA